MCDVAPSADTAQGKEYLLLYISCTTSLRGYDLSNYFYGIVSLVKIMETTFSVVRILIHMVTKAFSITATLRTASTSSRLKFYFHQRVL